MYLKNQLIHPIQILGKSMSLDSKCVESRVEKSTCAQLMNVLLCLLRLAVPHVPNDDQSVGLASLIIVGTQAHLFVR